MTPHSTTTLLCLALATALGACADAGPSLEEIRAATSKYQSVEAALADGYVRDPMDVCETSYYAGSMQNEGTMGVHYFRPELLGVAERETRLDAKGTNDDFLHPSLLVYEPQADNTLALVAVGNMVSASAWAAAGHRAPPTLGRQPYTYWAAAATSGTAYYDLHVWLYRDNPSGMFAPYNPAVTCAHHAFNLPAIVPPDSLHSAPHH